MAVPERRHHVLEDEKFTLASFAILATPGARQAKKITPGSRAPEGEGKQSLVKASC